ncbi:MAG: YtxH domain-containing protein [Cyclobacteriaceae bacterium]|jgi:gas vesicle protein|nr:YtxH domain-containing protein [Cyclobacteriaceae bacterium]
MEAKNLIGGLLAGATIGVAVGILLAPRSGVQTRKKLMRESKHLLGGLKHSVEDSVGDLKVKYNQGIDELAKRSKGAIAHASDRVKI